MITGLVKSVAARMGADIRRLSPLSNAGLQTVEIVRRLGFDIVFDVGANLGQFGSELRHYGYTGDIVSFEPLMGAHSELVQRAAGDPRWHVHPRCALGNEAGSTTIHVAGNLASSSLLPMNRAHVDAAPTSAYVASETVEVHRFDAAAAPYLKPGMKAFLKIDTQGFERQVLEGAGELLSAIDGALLEMSLLELYDGQTLWLDLMEWMTERGLSLWAMGQGFIDPLSLRTLQVDGIFIREVHGSAKGA
jgi:FkbM family methyltransferase